MDVNPASPTLPPGLWLAVYCLAVLIAALAGGWLIPALRLTHARLQVALSAVAGLMLGVALLHFLPHALAESPSIEGTMRWLVGGFVAMFLLQRFFSFHHHELPEDPIHRHPAGAPSTTPSGGNGLPNSGPPEPPGVAPARQLSWATTAIGLSLHSLVDGVALTAAVTAGAAGSAAAPGLAVALAVILHKPFGAMAIGTLMTAGRCPPLLRQGINVLFALVTPLGALAFRLGLAPHTDPGPAVLSPALAFCAGTFLCIACADLLPELQFHSHDRLKLSFALLAGLAVATLLGLVEAGDHGDHHGAASSVTDRGTAGGPPTRPATTAAQGTTP